MPIELNSYRHLSRKVTAVLAAFGRGRLRFIEERGLYSVCKTPQGWHVSATSVSGLLYVAERHCYREIEKAYPIERLADLKDVLAQQYAGEHCAHVISEPTDHQRRVVTFVYQKSLKAQLPRFCVLLPESFVLASAYAGNHIKAVIQSDDGSWFLYVRGDKFSSQTASPLCPDMDRFAMVHGVPEIIPQESVSSAAKVELLMNGLANITPLHYLNFITLQSQASKPLPWKLIGAIVFSGLLAYFTSVTLYLKFVQQNAEQTLEQISAETTQLLKAQRKQEQLMAQLMTTQDLLNQQQRSSRTWSLVFYFLENEVKISSLLWAEGQLIVQGATPDAVNLLQRVTALPYVRQAKFSESTRRERDLDNFSMAIVFADEVKRVK